MAIQTRRGLEAEFDPSKMLPGEWAVSLDTKYVRMCFSPGVVMRMATYESFEEDMIQIQQILATCEDIQTAVEAFEVLAEQHANDAAASATASANSATASANSATLSESWAIGNTGERPGEDTNNAKYWSEVAQSAANVEIMTPTKLGIGKPDNITIGVSNGTFSTKFKNYTSLADLGLTAPKTCLEIATAMSDNSRIMLDGINVSDNPIDGGTIIVERKNEHRAHAYYYSSKTDATISRPIRSFVKYLRIQSQLESPWVENLTTGNLTNNLLATVKGTALDAVQGKALDDKITELNQKLPQSGYQIRIGSTAITCAPNATSTLSVSSLILNAFGWTQLYMLVPVLSSSIPSTLFLSYRDGVIYVYNNSAEQYDNVPILYIAIGK